MRTVFKNFLVLAVMLGTFTSFANEMLEVTPTFNYVTKGNHISVSDAFGEVIYSGEINYSGNLTTLFDFTQLKNGKYDVEVTNGFRIDISTIEVKNNIVFVTDANRKTIFKPVVRNENNSVLISKLALDGEKMDVELFYEGELIYTETIDGEDVLNRVYKLDKTLKGSYTTVIKSNDRVFVKNFRI
ncbi:hypothetical protein DFQ10_101278 [Winogradskyella eximia]|jgi:hypothetical protein|uniref:Secreted protein (Por secretion system target) n=1 Tax=Winogradskyella eximia TaxID=262006 RepID=A0A3D9HAJ6_9FLAO|nr:hypothetical protein [Winogradskyella eximia]RED46507.1 hypothetical protein DFQ10_101278 [Winogradskyella eximia]|tara:strand:- start:586 stop:1143 length:558 start_codon:yes stop_codon:yes gene_type:complete